MEKKIYFSIIMPIYNQASYVRRAINSLVRQSYQYWELIIVDDGSTDNMDTVISDFLFNRKIRLIKLNKNIGIGAAINIGLKAAKYDYIAYLPADDYYFENHLEVLRGCFKDDIVVLAYSGVHYDSSPRTDLLYYKDCKGAIPGMTLQLVQVAHKKTSDYWTERSEYVSEDYFYLYWHKLCDKGLFMQSDIVTCEWSNHPYQHHKLCGEKYGGGINIYRSYYHVQEPIIFRARPDKLINERENYKLYREKNLVSSRGLKILIVGELAYNPERIYCLERAGNKLYGLWSKPRFGYSSIGPLPFGNVEDIEYRNWRERVNDIKPDIIYALLSTSAIDLAYEVLTTNTDIPFVWHFKEGPSEAMKAGLWDKLIYLYRFADGKIFLNEENKAWFQQFIPPMPADSILLMDGDMPIKESFGNKFSNKLSSLDGEVHTVVAGRMVGISIEDYKYLSTKKIHLHIYTENSGGLNQYVEYLRINPSYFHLHPHCPQQLWTEEFSKYDAGWLHSVPSSNENDILRMTWADINLPARISTYLAAGIPMIQLANNNHLFAQRSYLSEYGVDFTYDSIKELCSQLNNREMRRIKELNVRRIRNLFTFDYNQERLMNFFNQIILKKINEG